MVEVDVDEGVEDEDEDEEDDEEEVDVLEEVEEVEDVLDVVEGFTVVDVLLRVAIDHERGSMD